MVKVRTPHGTVFTVPSGSVEAYERMGFVLVGEKETEDKVRVTEPQKQEQHESAVETNESETTNPDEVFLEKIIKKPIGQWTKKEATRFMKLNDFDKEQVQGKTLDEVKQMIADFLK